MKVNNGVRTPDGCTVTVATKNGVRNLPLRHDLRRHSEAFEWNFSGSGPAQLALALCADVLGDDDRARTVYQKVKFRLLGNLPGDEWTFTAAQIWEAIDAIEKERVT